MTSLERCDVVGSPQLAFWYKTSVTLATPLSPDQVRERLKAVLPRIRVLPDAGVVFPIRIPVRRVYVGRVYDNTFSLYGPMAPRHAGAKLSVQGTIEQESGRSLIHLTVYSAGAMFGLVLVWTAAILLPCLWWMLDGAFSTPPLFLAGMLVVLALIVYPIGVIGARIQLGYLLNHLKSLFGGEGTPGAAS